jgi:hypothetical protein
VHVKAEKQCNQHVSRTGILRSALATKRFRIVAGHRLNGDSKKEERMKRLNVEWIPSPIVAVTLTVVPPITACSKELSDNQTCSEGTLRKAL